MSFLSERSPSQMVGTVIGLILLSLATRAWMAGGLEELMNPGKRAENQIVAALENNPGDLAVLRAMERHFPLDYDRLLDTMSSAALRSAPPEQVMEAGSLAVARFMQQHANDFASAPEDRLDGVLALETELIETLNRSDPLACGDYLHGTVQQGDLLLPRVRELMGEVAAAKVAAMAAGRENPALRLLVNGKHVQDLASDMRAMGASMAQLTFIVEGRGGEALTEQEQCSAGVHLVHAIAGRPDAERVLLIGTLLGTGGR